MRREFDSATRREVLTAALAVPVALALPTSSLAQSASHPFDAWVITFRARWRAASRLRPTTG